ncbi:MAG: hypothetical protein CMC38_06260 [Flavobacteriaceae bacterium]|nr:hypothetical protein [Flavobacteriaceae bacterium]|tara:strand:+ start:1401 stop:1916 length:516 start_codon:yes stop_codon:yes gene_type:complete
MIFKSLHNKLLKKKIENSLIKLSNQRRFKPNPIKTLGCIVDPSFPVSVDKFIELSNSLGLKEKDFKIITFQENKNTFNVFSNMNMTPECVSFSGNLNGKDSLEFISFEFDLLINFFRSNNFLILLSSKTNAKFRVGFESVDSKLNDLIFSEKIKNFLDFKLELIKYLKLIK